MFASSPNLPGAWPGWGLEPTSPVGQRPKPRQVSLPITPTALDGRVDELALYKRLLTAGERAWLHNNGQGRAYTDIPAPQLPPDVSLTYTYGDPAHAHAVTALGDNKYEYDENGNMSVRWISGTRTMLTYDAENRVVSVTTCPDADGDGCDATETEIAQFTYDGDGKRVKSVEGGVTILFVGGHYEVKGSEVTKYYGVYPE